MRIVQVRGVTGAGKTSAMRKAIELAGGGITRYESGRSSQKPVTVTSEFTVMGDYNNPADCVGVDRYGNRHELLCVAQRLMKSNVDRIAFEGMVYSQTYALASKIDGLAKRNGYEFSCVFLNADFDLALSRVFKRNGGKPVDYDKLAYNVMRFQIAREKIKRAGIRCVELDVQDMSIDDVGEVVFKEIMR